MAPNLTGSATGLFLAETEVISSSVRQPSASQPAAHSKPVQTQRPRYRWRIVWRNVLAFIYLHTASLYGLYLASTVANPYTILWAVMLGFLGAFGVTAGAHRLWAHRAYKAAWPLRVVLIFFQTLAFQNHIYEWVRDHRVHHKFTDTDADPHNSARGFFFSHIGWLMVRKHKDVVVKGKTVDMSDLEKDWVVMVQKKIYVPLVTIVCFAIPTWVPYYFWGESAWSAWYIASILRYTLSLNFTWLVNSAAHIWGMRPYDRTISPTENITVAMLAFGEGWHNYHHSFPWDYKTSELGGYKFNFTTAFIDLCAKLGLAYDLKTASDDLIKLRVARKGDGSHPSSTKEGREHRHIEGEDLWGWGDSDMPTEEKKMVSILHKKED